MITKPRLDDVLGLERLRGLRDTRRMLGQIRGTAGLARLARMTTSEARQLAMALRRAADRGLGEAVSVHSTSCKAMDARCHCSVVVLVPGARA